MFDPAKSSKEASKVIRSTISYVMGALGLIEFFAKLLSLKKILVFYKKRELFFG